MKLTSPAFAEKVPLPIKYTGKGPSVSPPFEFLEVPKDTKSLVLIVEDLDSEKHRIHWLVYNIPASSSFFEEGKIPEGAVEGICNDSTPGYAGPCPTDFSGIHRFAFNLYALDTILEVPATADVNVIRSEMQNHVLEMAELVGIAEGEQVSHTA
jgi:Raf kinase inhibitor-like YbhB/YbcL family protein